MADTAEAVSVPKTILTILPEDDDVLLSYPLKTEDKEKGSIDPKELYAAAGELKRLLEGGEISIKLLEKARQVKLGEADAKGALLKILNPSYDSGARAKKKKRKQKQSEWNIPVGLRFDFNYGAGEFGRNTTGLTVYSGINITPSGSDDPMRMGFIALGGASFGYLPSFKAFYRDEDQKYVCPTITNNGLSVSPRLGGGGYGGARVSARVDLSIEALAVYQTVSGNLPGLRGDGPRPSQCGGKDAYYEGVGDKRIDGFGGEFAIRSQVKIGEGPGILIRAGGALSSGFPWENQYFFSVGFDWNFHETVEVKKQQGPKSIDNIHIEKPITEGDEWAEFTVMGLPAGMLKVGLVSEEGKVLDTKPAEIWVEDLDVSTFKVKLPKLEAGKDIPLFFRLVSIDDSEKILAQQEVKFPVASKPKPPEPKRVVEKPHKAVVLEREVHTMEPRILVKGKDDVMIGMINIHAYPGDFPQVDATVDGVTIPDGISTIPLIPGKRQVIEAPMLILSNPSLKDNKDEFATTIKLPAFVLQELSLGEHLIEAKVKVQGIEHVLQLKIRLVGEE